MYATCALAFLQELRCLCPRGPGNPCEAILSSNDKNGGVPRPLPQCLPSHRLSLGLKATQNRNPTSLPLSSDSKSHRSSPELQIALAFSTLNSFSVIFCTCDGLSLIGSGLTLDLFSFWKKSEQNHGLNTMETLTWEACLRISDLGSYFSETVKGFWEGGARG